MTAFSYANFFVSRISKIILKHSLFFLKLRTFVQNWNRESLLNFLYNLLLFNNNINKFYYCCKLTDLHCMSKAVLKLRWCKCWPQESDFKEASSTRIAPKSLERFTNKYKLLKIYLCSTAEFLLSENVYFGITTVLINLIRNSSDFFLIKLNKNYFS